MVKCVITFCKNDTRNLNKQNSCITFHQFPKDLNLLKKWIEAVSKTNWEPNAWSKICSLHFPDSSFYETKNGLRRLVHDAVPSIFLQQSIDNRQDAVVYSNSGLINEPLPNKTDTRGKEELKREIIRLEDIAKRRRMRCNALYASRRRLKKKVLDLSQELKELKK